MEAIFQRITVGLFLLLAVIKAEAQTVGVNCSEINTLTWVAPGFREDGSALQVSEIDGYIIALTSDVPLADGSLSTSINIDGGDTLSFTHDNPIKDCGAGTLDYYLATVDTQGNVSALAAPVSRSMAGGIGAPDDSSLPRHPDDIDLTTTQRTVLTTRPCTDVIEFSCARGGALTITPQLTN